MSTQRPSPSLTALVAGANPFIGGVVRDVLGRAGIRIAAEVRDGAEALSALGERRPDLLVLDWELPVIGVHEIVAMARDEKRSRAPAMPVVVTMTEPTLSAVRAALELKVDAIVAAPFSPRELRARLEHIVRNVSTSAASSAGTA